MRRHPIVLLALFAVLMAACGIAGTGGSIEGSWQLESGLFDEEPIPLVASHPIILNLDEGQVGGTAACNNFGGTYNLSGDEIAFTEFAITEMACFPEEVMTSESAFITALFNVETAEVVDNRLVLSGSRSELMFGELAPVPTADLQGTVWVLDGLVQGESVSSVSGDRATLELFSDGSFIGSTGCRTVTGSYLIAGSLVHFTDFTAHGECPADLQDQDGLVITVLEGGFRVAIDADTLTLSIAGDEALIYKVD